MNQTDELDEDYDKQLALLHSAYGFVTFHSENHDRLSDCATGDVGTMFYNIGDSHW